jgi:hypothetical protein
LESKLIITIKIVTFKIKSNKYWVRFKIKIVLYIIGLSFQNLSFGLSLNVNYHKCYVTTLALGSWPKQKHGKRCVVKVQLRNHIHTFGNVKMWEIMKEWTHTFSRELSLWELESLLSPKFLESDFKGQNSLDWKVPYTIGKFLKHRCLKWACMTIWVLITQVMAERKVKSQSANLIPDH